MKKTGLLWSVCVVLIITLFIVLGQGSSIRAAQTQEEDTGLVSVAKEYKVKITVNNKKARVFVDGNPQEQGTVMLAEGIHSLDVSGEGIKSKAISFNVNQDRELNVKTDPPESRLTHQNTLAVGSLPKGMEFTKDGKYLFISLLGESAIVMLDSESEDMQIIKRIEPADKRYKNAGFVEIGISPLEDAVLASQMTTASVHRIPLTGETPFEITETIPTGGTWSKVITFNSDGSKFAVSNWTSWDVTIFSYPEMKLLQKISIPGIPRGMVFADEDKTLYVSNYSNGALHKVDLTKGKVVSTISVKRLGALRHLVLDEEKNIMYASDMQMECINVYDLTAFKLIKQIKVDYNPNTIAFSPDKKYLYVSCRGPNAKTTYLDRSPRNSYLYIIDCEKQEVIERRELGNQPTALAVHPSGKYITVSNFRDKNIEIYQVDEMIEIER
ncbi:MAG: hypothetical protein CVU87_07130 [Firmicutes bacterium HGW-Firmicutes-12]|jgi:DNA-binding beta-propeller fold protein YncE|nr:MAG: hypothetical protein CVU87_07130 [Firmicutes bacterium HGW-Firmicutes-12]